MSKKTRKTQLPGVPNDASPPQRRFLDAVKQAVEIGEGVRGDPLDTKLTRRDLVELGVAKVKEAYKKGGIPGGDGNPIENNDPPPDLTSPPKPTGFSADGAFSKVILSWDRPNYSNHGFTEVWRAEVDNVGKASLVGTQAAKIHTDSVGGGFEGYYWIRHVSEDGVEGPFSSSEKAETAPDYEEIRDSMTAKEWEPDTPYPTFDAVSPTENVTINGTEIRLVANVGGRTGSTEPDWASEASEIGDLVTDNEIVWRVVDAGKIPFLIDRETGYTLIDAAIIQEATIEVAKIKDGFFDNLTADKGTITEANISIATIWNILVENLIQSDNFVSGSSGWRIKRNGDFEANNATFRGNGVFEGTIRADRGYISKDITIGSTEDTIEDVRARAIAADENIDDVTNRLDEWERPGTTLIDGNKIFTGDAYVDTLSIKGQAVTFPQSAFTSGTTSHGDYGRGGSWYTAQDLTINVQGPPAEGENAVPVDFIVSLAYAASADSGTSSDNEGSLSAKAKVRVLLDGQVIYNTYMVAYDYDGPDEARPAVAIRGLATIPFQDRLYVGSHSVQFQITFEFDPGGDARDPFWDASYSRRYIRAFEAKR